MELEDIGSHGLGHLSRVHRLWEAEKILSHTKRELLGTVCKSLRSAWMDSVAVFAGACEVSPGKWKNMSYQATEGPRCPWSRKETHHLRVWSERREYLVAQDPEQRVERALQLRFRPPGKSSSLQVGWVNLPPVV